MHASVRESLCKIYRSWLTKATVSKNSSFTGRSGRGFCFRRARPGCLRDVRRNPINTDGMPACAHALRQLEHAFAAPAPHIENGHSLKPRRKRHVAKARISELPIHLVVVLLELTVGHRIVQTDTSRRRGITHHACAIPEFAVASASRSFLRSFKSSGTMNAVVVRIDSVSANGYVKQMA